MNHNVNAIIQLMHYNTDFGNNLCSILDRLGCSRKDLADVTGLSRASISRYCNSQRLPRNEGRSLGQLIDGIVSLAEKLHEKLSSIRVIGWDIAITSDGPVFIEGNDNPEISGLQTVNGGLKQTILGLLKNEFNN